MQPQKPATQGTSIGNGNPFSQGFASYPFEAWSTMAGPMAFWANYAQQSISAATAVRHEWNNFLHKRAERDIATLSKLMSARTLEEYMTAYANFWKEAAEDYQKEFGEIQQLYGSIVENSSAAMQSAAKRSARDRWCETDTARH